MSGFVDAHCHLGQYTDPMGTLRVAHRAGVVTVAVTESPEEYRRLRTRFGNQPGLRLALGAHPLNATAVINEVRRFGRLLLDTDYVGEIGLDYSPRGRSTKQVQRRLFETLLEIPLLRHKVVSVHSRAAERETVSLLSAAGVTAVLHWWTGPTSVIDTALAAGLWFSVNEPMTRSKNGRMTLAALPFDRVITETDGPYARTGAQPSAPIDVRRVVDSLAGVWGVSVGDAQDQVWKNMSALHKQVVSRTAVLPSRPTGCEPSQPGPSG